MKSQNLLLKKATAAISKKVLVAAIALTCFTASAFATGDEANERAINNLKKEFKNAQNVEWKVTSEYTKATFEWNKQHMDVYYNDEGKTLAISRQIDQNVLPIQAQQYITQHYGDYRLAEAIEFNSDETGTCYYVSVTKDAKKKILRISTEGEVSIYHK